ncbi:Gx transporter family protein [uncultured Catenibacterium sp.]|uniref:Gx transporter family protein n=1 Tax=uncultured Catenibacterium sp. TaxID=286142 RepID=UPI002638ECC5|nr:Gx transporter family protein [uncultured Catenibacterium sp.]
MKNNRMIKHTKVRQLCFLAVFCAISIIFNYIEMLFPIYLGIPGAKLGLANIVSLTILLCFGFKYAVGITLLRIFIIGITFTNPYMMLYSLAGGVLSITIMAVMVKTHLFSNIIVSIVGGVSHNIGQLLIAFIFFSTSAFIYYLPYLILLGVVSGTVVGIIAQIIYIKIR